MLLMLLCSGSRAAAAGSLESLAIRWVHAQGWARYPVTKQHFPLKRKIEFSGASCWMFPSESQGWDPTKPQPHYPTPLLALQFELNCLSLTSWGPKQGDQCHDSRRGTCRTSVRATASPAWQESTSALIQLLPNHLSHSPALLPCPTCVGYKQGVTAEGRRPNLPSVFHSGFPLTRTWWFFHQHALLIIFSKSLRTFSEK